MGVNYSVKVRRKDNIEKVIKRFIKKCKKLGIIDEAKDRRHFTKPSKKKTCERTSYSKTQERREKT